MISNKQFIMEGHMGYPCSRPVIQRCALQGRLLTRGYLKMLILLILRGQGAIKRTQPKIHYVDDDWTPFTSSGKKMYENGILVRHGYQKSVEEESRICCSIRSL
mmetsp:Transcript_941/g.1662  ORF Transcript_941/g.1662 Transcript_941/m.1662 type:complete len:104 (-) Transcript_941:45-356(-)